jgi:predicted component of type VI protein secretion system
VSEREPLWGSGALALAPVIASSFVKTGWPGRISGDQDGRLEDLPVWTSDTGHVPLAAVVSGEKQTELAEAGFVVLSCEPDRDTLCVTYAPTVRRVGRYANEAERTEALAHASLASQLFVARAAQLLLAYQEALQPGAVLSDVQSDLAGRLRALMRTTSEDSVQVDPVQGAPGRHVLAVRLRPPPGILPQPVSLVMGLQLPAEPDERAV